MKSIKYTKTEDNTTIIPVKLFNLKYTFESAQPITFYGDLLSDKELKYVDNKELIHIKYEENNNKGIIKLFNSDNYKLNNVIKTFGLNENMKTYYKKIVTDEHLEKAVNLYNGMRLTLNDPWVTTVCFILSQFNNVKRIRKITKNIIDRYGVDTIDKGTGINIKTFPSPEIISKLTNEELLKCGTGFRSKYLIDAAQVCSENIDLYKLNPKNYDSLRENLLSIKGVGLKVADCIILMGYGNLNAFPIDVWMKRTMERLYFNSKPQKLKDIYDFSYEKWGKYRGFAQQYLFFYGMKYLGRVDNNGKREKIKN
jgi:N-glycosylase/DNA lyase